MSQSIGSKRFNQIDCRCLCKQIMTSRGVCCFGLSWICPLDARSDHGRSTESGLLEFKLPNLTFSARHNMRRNGSCCPN